MDPSGSTIPQVAVSLDNMDLETQASQLNTFELLIKDFPDEDKINLISQIAENLPKDVVIDVIENLFDSQVCRRDPKLSKFLPKDVIRHIISASHKLFEHGMENIAYHFMKGLGSDDLSHLLPLNSLPFSVIYLILMNLFGSGLEQFHKQSSSIGIINWLLTSCELLKGDLLLQQINKILFPFESVKYKLETIDDQAKIVLEVSSDSVDVQTDSTDGAPNKSIPSLNVSAQEEVEKLTATAKLEEINDTLFDSDNDASFADSDDAESYSKAENTEKAVIVKKELEDQAGDDFKVRAKLGCRQCDEAFFTKKALRKHEVLSHCLQKDGTYTCLKCDKTNFKTILSLAKHDKAHQRSNIYACRWDNCTMKFPTAADLQLHVETHSKILCDICGASFKQRATLKKHIANMHAPKPEVSSYKCDFCHKEFTSRFQFRFHMSQAHGDKVDKQFECEKCEKRFTCKRNLQTHLAGIHGIGQKKFKCPLCEKSFHYEHLLSKHQARWHTMFSSADVETSSKVKCEMCHKIFKHALSLRHHVKMMHTNNAANMPAMSCNKCDKMFRSQAGLIKHKAIFHGIEQSYKCSVCDDKFQSQKDYVAHMADVHNTKETSFTCSECDKDFISKNALLRHERVIHQGLKEFQCDHCDADFSSTIALERHVKHHEGVAKEHKCAVCGNAYYTERHLKRHMRHMHSRRERKVAMRVQCEKCEKTFVEKRYLERHIQREHLGRTDFDCQQCGLCGQYFSGKSSLNRHHRRIHQGLKDHTTRDYQCDECPKMFVFKQSLQRHMASAHHKAVPPHQCDVCGKRFANKFTLKKHTENHSSEDVKPTKGVPVARRVPRNALGRNFSFAHQQHTPGGPSGMQQQVLVPQKVKITAPGQFGTGQPQIIEVHVSADELVGVGGEIQHVTTEEFEALARGSGHGAQADMTYMTTPQEDGTTQHYLLHDQVQQVSTDISVSYEEDQQGEAGGDQYITIHQDPQGMEDEQQQQQQLVDVSHIQQVDAATGGGLNLLEIPAGVKYIRVGEQLIKVQEMETM